MAGRGLGRPGGAGPAGPGLGRARRGRCRHGGGAEAWHGRHRHGLGLGHGCQSGEAKAGQATLAGQGLARQAGYGKARRGPAGRAEAGWARRQGAAWAMARRGRARRGPARLARQAGLGGAWQAGPGRAWLGWAWQGRRGMASRLARRGGQSRPRRGTAIKGGQATASNPKLLSGRGRTIMSKSSENRLRPIAKRRGYILRKSPRRDPGALDYGLYAVVDIQTKDWHIRVASFPTTH